MKHYFKSWYFIATFLVVLISSFTCYNAYQTYILLSEHQEELKKEMKEKDAEIRIAKEELKKLKAKKNALLP